MNASESRNSIFAKIEAATAALPTKAPLPDYDVTLTHALPKLAGTDLWEIFRRNFTAVNGRPMEAVAQLIEFLQSTGQRHGYCDPALFDLIGSQLAAAGLTVETAYDRTRYDDYQFGITRASGAIAESGTLILDDERTRSASPRSRPGSTSRCWCARKSTAPSPRPSPPSATALTSSGAPARPRPPMSKASSSKACTAPANRSRC
jgi:hypothetical protein